MSPRSKKPSRRSQNALFKFVRRAADIREAMPTLTDFIAILDDSKREADEEELRALQLEAEYKKRIRETEAEYIAKGDIEGLEWYRHYRAQIEELSRSEIELRTLELKYLAMEKETEAMEEETARLKAEAAEYRAKTEEYRLMLGEETA